MSQGSRMCRAALPVRRSVFLDGPPALDARAKAGFP
jgi:hypothetical protein